MKQVEVSIMGQSYLLGCPEGGEVELRQAVSHVDREMCAIRDSGKLKARERIAVLAALNLAYELAQNASKQAAATPAVSSMQADPALPSTVTDQYLQNLLSRLDTTLSRDGHLL